MLSAGFNLLREGDGVKNLFTSLEDRKNIVKKYLDIIKNNNFKSNNILMLVDNNVIRLNYIRQMTLDLSEELKICTYSQFVREEITKYWTIISSACKDIVNKSLSPIFISTNLKTYIFETKVSDKRNRKNYFADITGTNRSIASNIVNNLDHAIYNDIDYRTIGERIYNSKSNKNNIDRFSYSQMDEIIVEYMEEMLKNSMVDDSISVYLYNNYLLKDELYLEQLFKRYDYLFVDDLQNISVSQVSLIDFFDRRDKEIYLYLDSNK
ncbi:MAG: UvrD-helicase domain-containing protein, partial [Intestinibacter sp.]